MNFKEFAEHMWPFWMLGVMIMGLVMAAGQKSLLRVEKKPLLKWIAFLGGLTIFRFLMCKITGYQPVGEGVKMISSVSPLIAFTVFWEDLCHGLPILILKKLIGVNKWCTKSAYMLMMLAVMVTFGLGHTYQGIWPAVFLSFYIPYSVQKGEQYGFGTIMIGHMLYDFVTFMFVRHLLGI
jgi:hypothetical protein